MARGDVLDLLGSCIKPVELFRMLAADHGVTFGSDEHAGHLNALDTIFDLQVFEIPTILFLESIVDDRNQRLEDKLR